jgi:hypothetical protein
MYNTFKLNDVKRKRKNSENGKNVPSSLLLIMRDLEAADITVTQ